MLPPAVFTTTGILTRPPDMYGIFAMALTICSKQTVTKSTNMISTIGRYPAIARPTAMPVKAISESACRARATRRSGPAGRESC